MFDFFVGEGEKAKELQNADCGMIKVRRNWVRSGGVRN
jgi:hypothetical protein